MQTLMKFCVLQHFIWVFAVCQRTCLILLGVSSFQRVSRIETCNQITWLYCVYPDEILNNFEIHHELHCFLKIKIVLVLECDTVWEFLLIWDSDPTYRVPTSSGNPGKPGKSLKQVPCVEKSWNLKKSLNNHGKIMEICEIMWQNHQ